MSEFAISLRGIHDFKKNMFKNIVIFGTGGAIGSAVLDHLVSKYPGAHIHACSSQPFLGDHHPQITFHLITYEDEQTLADAAQKSKNSGPIDLIFVATGLLHQGALMPEKSLKEITADKFITLYKANTIIPALIAKHFLPHLTRDGRGVYAVLSARVGSISDNQWGGWYAYRCAKAALNMLVKNLSIEMARRYPDAVILGLHPGTVDSALSAPFQKQVPADQLFTPKFAAEKLISILETIQPVDTGKCFAWDGQEIKP